MRHVRTPCAATLDFDAAQAILAAIATPLGAESVALAKAGRRVLAAPLHARVDVPARDLAAMDGFALRDADLAAGLRSFAVIGAAWPGTPWPGEVAGGQAVRIMTGAPMPSGADRVLMRECVTDRRDTIALEAPLPPKPHVRTRGSDTAAGAEVLPAGKLLDPRALVVAAAADADRVTVWRRPRVRVIATGDELVAPGAARESGGVPDSLSEAILLLARQWGAAPMGAEGVRDDAALLTAVAEAALESADVLVLCGGASRGDRDFAKAGLAPLGLQLAFADVAIKPGKPVWLGSVGKALVLGLPGNPTAAMTVARLFLAPLLTALGGRGVEPALRWQEASLIGEPPPTGDREAFLCAERVEGGVRVIARQAASDQCMLARADTLARFRPGERHAPGTPVPVLSF